MLSASILIEERIRINSEIVMGLAGHKRRIVASVGPASDLPQLLERLIRAGIHVAHLIFSSVDQRSPSDMRGATHVIEISKEARKR